MLTGLRRREGEAGNAPQPTPIFAGTEKSNLDFEK